nr:MAG TPA: hypothetical protein [Caudoviricetes sp.]
MRKKSGSLKLVIRGEGKSQPQRIGDEIILPRGRTT